MDHRDAIGDLGDVMRDHGGGGRGVVLLADLRAVPDLRDQLLQRLEMIRVRLCCSDYAAARGMTLLA